MSSDPFPRLMHTFFYERMVRQRNASVNTLRSNHDTWWLFLGFVARRRGRPVVQLGLADLGADEINAFLQSSQTEHGATIGTRDCCLSALGAFLGFVAEREPTAIARCSEILCIPTKRAPITAPSCLEPEEV